MPVAAKKIPLTSLRGLRGLPTAPDLLALATRRFLKGQRVRVEELAAELGVSRATAYRWVGNNEQLVGAVIASLREDVFRRALHGARGRGAARVVDMMARGMRLVAAAPAYRAFLEREPEKALRIVASKAGPVQAGTIALHQRLLEEEIERGHLRLPVDAHTMAYALVRIAESFLYADLIAGEKPDIAKAVEIVKLMLRPDE
jgi:AcrR family transcriptional regulator